MILSLSKIVKTIENYIKNPDTNIFKNHIDALLGSIILIILPLLSILSLIKIIDEASLFNYAFPMASICLAGAYDTYGRYETGNSKNIKLAIRIVFDFSSIALALIALVVKSKFLLILAPVILLLPSIMIIFEVYTRVKTAIEISKWYAN